MKRKKFSIVPACAIVAAALMGFAVETKDTSPMEKNNNDQKAIKDVIAEYVIAWNARDFAAWGKLFTTDVDYINRGGGWWQSNADNVEGHKNLFASATKDPPRTYQASVSKITFLKNDIALVHAEWAWPGVLPSEQKKAFKGIMMIIMIKQDGKWLIRALQNTVSSS